MYCTAVSICVKATSVNLISTCGKKKESHVCIDYFLWPCNRPVIYSHLTLEWREQRVLPIYVTPQQYLLLWTKTLPVDCLFVILMMSHCCFIFSPPVRMDTTEQCNAVISHFNGKFIKIASGALGRKEFCTFLYTFLPIKTVEAVMIDCRVTVNMSFYFFCALPPAPSQPLLCKFADSQRKKHAQGGFVPNGQSGDLRLVCNSL